MENFICLSPLTNNKIEVAFSQNVPMVANHPQSRKHKRLAIKI